MSAVAWVRGSLEHALAPEGLNDPDAGVLAVRVPPGLTRGAALGSELLRGLGKDETLDGVRHQTTDIWLHLRAWLLAHPIRDVVLASAEHCRPTHLVSIAEIVAAAGARVWLHTEGATTKQLEPPMAAWAGEPLAAARFAELWRTRRLPRPTPAGSTPTSYPRVPRADFPTFRAACRDLLSPPDFALVDARYVAAFAQAQERLVQPTPDSVGAYLRTELGACASADELLVVLRAIQAALFRAGWLLQVALGSFLALMEREPRLATRGDAAWARLRPYTDPLPGALTALRASGLDVADLPRVTVGAIAADGSAIDYRGEHAPVEEPARVYLRAQRALRLTDGATSREPLFWRREGAISEVLALRALRRPMSQIGVALASATPQTKAKGWLRENGLTLTPLR